MITATNPRPAVKPAPKQTDSPVPLTSSDLSAGAKGREFILIGGKDGVGKTCALMSIAMAVNGKLDVGDIECCVPIINPSAKVFVLDTEHKFASVYRQFGSSAPDNIIYYYCQTMDALLSASEKVWQDIKPGDWVMPESMARIWEHAQDLAYREISGMSKSEYLTKLREHGEVGGKKGPIPQPDNFWNIAKTAHDGEFLQVLVARDDINVVMTTIIVRPPREAPNRKENIDRKELRMEFGLDAGLGGTPTLPYQPETLVLLDRVRGEVKASVLRDNNSVLDDGRVEFWLPGKKSFGPAWMRNCRFVACESE